MQQLPPVRRIELPALLRLILPQQVGLVANAGIVPQAVAQPLTRTRSTVDHLEQHTGRGPGSERLLLPVFLRHAFPRRNVKLAIAYVAENEPDEIVIRTTGFDEKCPLKIQPLHLVVTVREEDVSTWFGFRSRDLPNSQPWITVVLLEYFCSIVQNEPFGI